MRFELRRRGGSIYFEPGAIVDHYNRPGFRQLLRRNYRWGYGAIESKVESGNARFPMIYRYPRSLMAASVLIAPATTAYVSYCWLRVGIVEPLWMLPALFAASVLTTW